MITKIWHLLFGRETFNHEEFLATYKQGRRDFSYTRLKSVDLSDSQVDLSRITLVGADLRLATLPQDLTNAKLGKVNLEGANLEGANLEGANLKGAKLWDANLSSSNLGGANLSGANLWGANLSWADLKGANLSGATSHCQQLCLGGSRRR